MRKIKFLAFLLLLTPCFFGCSMFANGNGSADSTAAKALLSTQAAIISIAQASDQLCSLNQIKQPDCDKIKGIYNKSKSTYDLAADSLAFAVKSGQGDKNSWAAYQDFHNQFMNLYLDLTKIAADYGILALSEGGNK